MPRRRRRGAPRADRGRGGPVPVPRDERRRASQTDGPQRVAAEPSRRGVAAAAPGLTTQPVEPATARRGRAPRPRSRRGHAGVPDRDAVGGAPCRRAPRVGRFCSSRGVRIFSYASFTLRDGTSLAQVHRGAHHPFALPDDDDHEAEEALVFGTPQYTRPAAPHHLHDVELAPDGGTLLDDSAHIRRRSFSHSDITRLSPPRPTAAERASSDGAAMRGSKSSGQLTRV